MQAQQSDYKSILNVNYYPESERVADKYINERCVLDLYLPEDVKRFPTVVWFHGGGLTGGNKTIPENAGMIPTRDGKAASPGPAALTGRRRRTIGRSEPER